MNDSSFRRAVYGRAKTLQRAISKLSRVGIGGGKGSLDPPLTDINHRARSGGQRFLLPIAVTRADLKPIVEEQGFHLLGKDIAQGCAKRLFLVLAVWMEPLVQERVVLNLCDRVVLLLLSDHIVSSIRHRILLWFGMAGFKEISWRGVACSKEETPLRVHMFPHSSQQGFLVRPG